MTRRSQDGFTLVEVMLTAAIVGFLAMIAVPGMEGWSRNQRVKSAGRSLAACRWPPFPSTTGRASWWAPSTG